MIILIVIGALFLTCAGGATLFMLSDAGKAMREITESAMNASTAPGTDELRALGCEPAMIMDFSAMGDLFRDADEEIPPELRGALSKMVICTSPDLDCPAVAESYLDSQRPETPFAVLVTTPDGETGCQHLYTPEGELLQDMGRG